MRSRRSLDLTGVLPIALALGGCFVEETPSDRNPVASTVAQSDTGDADDSQGYESGQVSGGTSGTSGGSPGSATQTSGDGSTGSVHADDSSGDGGSEGGGTIDVTLSGCDVDLGGTVVVSYNGSLGVASVYDGAALTGSLQFDLDGVGVYALSTQHRVDTGTVVNLVEITQGTWTNLDPDGFNGRDTIGGTLTVTQWDPASGVSELHFENVSLRNTSTAGVCTIDGTIVTTHVYP